MCGDCDPHDTEPMLRAAFRPERMDVQEQLRGLV